MSKPALPAVTRVPNQLLACAVSGSMIGQVVVGLATQHDGALFELFCALVFVLAGGASVLMVMRHLHAAQQPHGTPAPAHAWLLALSAGVLASIHLGSLLAA